MERNSWWSQENWSLSDSTAQDAVQALWQCRNIQPWQSSFSY